MSNAAIAVGVSESLLSRAKRPAIALALLFGLVALLAGLPGFANDWTYRMRPGDTVWDLSGKYLRKDIPSQQLQAHNRIADPHRIPPGTLIRLPVAWLKVQPAKATVVGIHGDAAAVDAQGQRRKIVQGMALGIGTTLFTSADASLTLQFADGSRLLLHGGSELKLDKLSAYGATGMTDTRMRLPKGRTSSEVKPLRGSGSHYIIETPDLMSSVRGTHFRVGSDGDDSQIEVTEGRVQVDGAGRKVLLRPNQGTVNAADGAPAAKSALLAEPASVELDATQRPMLLRWAAVPGAERYRVQVGATAAFPYLLHDRVVTDLQDSIDGLPDGTHGIRVRAIDAQGIEGRDAVIEAQVTLAPPFAIETVDRSQVDVEQPRFRWGTMGPGVRYHFQLAGAGGFEKPLLDLPNLPATELRSPLLLPPGDYAWRIAAIDSDGRMSRYNDMVRFVVLPPATGPAVSGDLDTTDRRALHLRWPAGQAGQQFRFQLSPKADFSELTVDRTLAEHQIALPRLGTGTWHARVQVIDSDGYARPFGPGQSFKVGCAPCRWVAGGGALILLLSL